MSNKSLLGVRGNGKPVTSFLQQIGQRSGKTVDGVVLELYDEMTPYPPATKEEAQAFLRVQIKRCNMNLANAKDRGDKRAIINLERKLAVYEYLHNLVITQSQDCYWATEQAYKNGYVEGVKNRTGEQACPNCLVYSIGSDGVCPVCGWKKVTACD